MTFGAQPRQTIARPVMVDGVGLHTGVAVKTTLVPAPRPGSGVVFRVAGEEIPALAANVCDTARCTVLGVGAARVSTVEHLLSALAGLGVSDLIVEVDGPELPIGDGSALLWVESVGAAGIAGLDQEIAPLILREPVVVYGEKARSWRRTRPTRYALPWRPSSIIRSPERR